jgi:PAS domain S-box-containing protein
MLGYAPGAIGHTQDDWNRLIHPDDAAAVEAAYQAHADGEVPQYRAIYRALRADGQWMWVEERGRIIERGPGGDPLRMLGTQTDATAQMALQQARQDQLAAEAANAAKTQFLSRMSHELRTPLNAVLGFAQLMALDPHSRLDETQRRRVSLIRQAGDYLLAMIGDLLDLSLIESGRLQVQVAPVHLPSLAVDAVDMVRGQAQAAQVTLLAPALPPQVLVLADPMRLKQVLINLLTNGIKYNRAGGSVQLSARAETDGHCVIEVADDGPGIAPERMDQLFQPFNRLGREHSGVPGSGLGLALSQNLVRAMGGELSAHSAVGQGAVFRIRLPSAA